MILEVSLLAVTVLYTLHWWAHSYWKRKNVASLPSQFLFGSIKPLLLQNKTIPWLLTQAHEEHKKQGMIGFYSFYTPMLYITNPDIVKIVLVSEFNSFHDDGFIMDKEVDPIVSMHPFVAKGSIWKELRAVQTSMQTVLKLKDFTQDIIKVTDEMISHIKKQNNQPILIQDMLARFTVGSAVINAFGLEPNSFSDPEFSFMKHASGENLFYESDLGTLGAFFMPFISKLFKLRIVSKEAENFFVSMTKQNVEHRLSTNINRGDLIDTVIKLNKKKLEQNQAACTPIEMAAHCATFYLDSTVTAAEVICFLMMELANDQDVQEKLRQEILSVGKKIEDFDYDKINSVAYLQMVLDETLRMHPPVTTLSRTCTKEITINDVKIEEGTKVFISQYALHHDPEYFPEPEKFKPERFSEVNKQSIVKYTYLPFGEGPRICVGAKYGTLLVKLSVTSILLKYKILPVNGKQEINYNSSGGGFILTSPPGITLKFIDL